MSRSRIIAWCMLCLCYIETTLRAENDIDTGAAARRTAAQTTATRIDELLAAHWQQRGLQPTALAAPHELARRLSLDLLGRVPTLAEAQETVGHLEADRYDQVVQRAIDGPEFPLHFARVVDGWVQHRQQGDAAFVEWLRQSLAASRSWDVLFRTILVGPWDGDADKDANRFLLKRVKSLDALTTDTTRAFFGVDITCARCHDHPLVEDWKQAHFYGMAAFFNRTQEASKSKIGEKAEGEVTFEARKGGQQTAPMMFLSGQSFASEKNQNRRERLVTVALEQQAMFSRAAANRAWDALLGRGLVTPVDQMHSGNEPSVPGLLEFLADDFAAHGYDLRHLVSSIVLSKAYRLSSRVDGAAPPDGSFAAARLRALTPRQFALSLVLVTGEPTLTADHDAKTRGEKYRALEKQAEALLTGLDPTLEGYQASAAEALFLSNDAAIQKCVQPTGENLAARLQREPSAAARVTTAFQAVLGRIPSESEQTEIVDRLGELSVSDLLWALTTSAEFRFCP